MAAVRNPLAARYYSHNETIAPSLTTLRRHSTAKRPCSSDAECDSSAKRAKVVTNEEIKKEKEKRRSDREHEFRVKYTRAFPSFVFYFDIDPLNSELHALRLSLEKRVTHMGARIDDFFSKEITHLITLQNEDDDKENYSRSHQNKSALGSPIRLRGRTGNDTLGKSSVNLVKKAQDFGMKVWSASKLDSVLNRCHAPSAASVTSNQASVPSKERSLSRLLESERLHGTAERDPTQRRHDFTYFSKNSYYVLIEDIRGELATIAAQEYPIVKGNDGKEEPGWPVLHCHPLARGPFVPYDERERRRRERADQADRERIEERRRRRAKFEKQERRRKVKAQLQARQYDLRRTVSTQNLQRRSTFPNARMEGFIDLDLDLGDDSTLHSANASGFLASGAYMAASGNSVGITSTTGTTSTAHSAFRTLQLPIALKDRFNQQVVTSRKVSVNADGKENKMGPPPRLPERATMLRKSRSTNTIRLPKREEGMKPGYCESCKMKFTDFQEHVISRKHRKFAADNSNWAQLDSVLARVRRRTKDEAFAGTADWNSNWQSSDELCPAEDDMAMVLPSHNSDLNDDVRWEEWVDADEM